MMTVLSVQKKMREDLTRDNIWWLYDSQGVVSKWSDRRLIHNKAEHKQGVEYSTQHVLQTPQVVNFSPMLLDVVVSPMNFFSVLQSIRYNTIQIQDNTIQYNTIQYNTVQYDTIHYKYQYNTIQYKYNTIQYRLGHTSRQGWARRNCHQHLLAVSWSLRARQYLLLRQEQ